MTTQLEKMNTEFLQHLDARLTKVEDCLEYVESAVKSKHFPPWRKLDPAGKLEKTREVTKQMFMERSAVLRFNREQKRKEEANDFDDRPVTWTNDTSGEVYRLVTDVHSWYWLTQSTVAPAKLTPNLDKFRVLVIDEELVTLSRDFRDGLGECILWTPWRDMRERSSCWKIDPVTKKSKIHVDPRVGILDPVTNKPWVGVDPFEEDEEEVVSDVVESKKSKKRSRQTGEEDSGSEFNPDEDAEEEEEEEEEEEGGEEEEVVTVRRKDNGKRKKVELTYDSESNESADEEDESSQGSASENEELEEEVKSKYHGQR